MISALTIHRNNVLGKTLGDIASRCGFSISYLSNVEHGKRPDVGDIKAIADGYDISVKTLCKMMGWGEPSENGKAMLNSSRVSRASVGDVSEKGRHASGMQRR